MKKVHVIPHTHWDFEWYFTNNESFIQLMYHMDEVIESLENDRISYYLLDGQMSLLDEYLSAFPEKKETIKRLVTDKKLIIGPWYTQTDELIISGESIVRNLELGIELADGLGGHMKIGYLPDSFGQSKDMPKIYNGFDFKQSVFWRGVPNDKTTDREFIWKAEDGSEVVVSNIKDGYYTGGALIYSDDTEKLMDKISKGATSEHLVMPVGGDQRYVDYNLRDRMAYYKERHPDCEFVESNYDIFFDELNTDNLETVEGEFISSSVSKIHRSIYSSRYDHKYLNDKIERRMIYQVEPLMIMADDLGIPYKKGALDRIWKLLSKNQAHDSAGGCNSDKTNRIIVERFIEADQLSYSIIDYLTRKIAESRQTVSENDLLFFNPRPVPMKKVAKFNISTEAEFFELVNPAGNSVPVQHLNTIKEYNGSIRKNKEDMDETNFYYIHEVLAEVEVAPMTFAEYKVIEKSTSTFANEKVTSQDYTIENDSIKVTYKDGQLELFNKKTNDVVSNFLSIEDSGDDGDTYDYSPPEEDFIAQLDFKGADATVLKGACRQTLEINGEWQVPYDLIKRSEKQCDTALPYRLKLSVEPEHNRIDCHLEVDNTALDHRLRAVVKTTVSASHSYTNTPFGTIKRDVVDKNLGNWQELGWKEEPTAIFPMINYINSHNEKSSWTVLSKGIKEYQLIGDNFENIALTLYRSVGFLGKPDLQRRPGIASGNEFKYVPTPDSQLLETLKFKFSIVVEEEYSPSLIMKTFEDYAISVPFYQIQELNRFTTTLKYFVSNPLLTKVEKPNGFEVQPNQTVLSSVRKNKDNNTEIRLFNPNMSEVQNGGKILLSGNSSFAMSDLLGNIVSEKQNGTEIDLGTFKPGEIKTVLLF